SAALLGAALLIGALSPLATISAQADPRHPGHGHGHGHQADAGHSLRGPVTDENFYFVMADRFRNGDTANDEGGLGSDRLVSGFDPTKKGFYNGGDLTGILDQLDYIEG